MLQANKARVLTSFHEGSVALRYREVEYFLMLFNRLAAIAALLAGFAASNIARGPGDPPFSSSNGIPFVLCQAATCAAFSLMLLVLALCLLATLWGPGQALRGGGYDAINKAATTMESCANQALMYFGAGVALYLFATMLLSFSLFSGTACLLSFMILLYTSMMICRSASEIYEALVPSVTFDANVVGNPLSKQQQPQEKSVDQQLLPGSGLFPKSHQPNEVGSSWGAPPRQAQGHQVYLQQPQQEWGARPDGRYSNADHQRQHQRHVVAQSLLQQQQFAKQEYIRSYTEEREASHSDYPATTLRQPGVS
eukprot:GHVT01098035.1.p1 GENE.GHVT01098035.1~~GHVT01098035.1.p1  ORF type:complete len:310 (-),score=61.42 GHVT01098035.1:718-1647(-)